jgi:hypothetical protein
MLVPKSTMTSFYPMISYFDWLLLNIFSFISSGKHTKNQKDLENPLFPVWKTICKWWISQFSTYILACLQVGKSWQVMLNPIHPSISRREAYIAWLQRWSKPKNQHQHGSRNHGGICPEKRPPKERLPQLEKYQVGKVGKQSFKSCEDQL